MPGKSIEQIVSGLGQQVDAINKREHHYEC
jgi:hypothetical protein